MSITAIGMSNASYYNLLAARLQKEGMSVQKAALVAREAKTSVEKIASDQKGPLNKAAIRTALDNLIASDVAAGTLTAEDAKTVSTALDQMDPNQTDPPSSGPTSAGKSQSSHHGGGGHGGGDGDGGSANKTEISETVTVMGSIKKTTILYSDGTSETTTAVLSNSMKDSKYVKSPVFALMQTQAETSQPQQKAANYLASLPPGSLFTFSV